LHPNGKTTHDLGGQHHHQALICSKKPNVTVQSQRDIRLQYFQRVTGQKIIFGPEARKTKPAKPREFPANVTSPLNGDI
jgi:hypothetical protein